MTAEAIVLTAITVLLLFYAWVAAVLIWKERPMVCWDERQGRWRSARLVVRERTGVWPKP
jgi:hypothetical protein